MDMADESIDLKNKVVAIFEDESAAAKASSAVSSLGRNVVVLQGEEGRARLPQNQGGIKGAVKTAAMTFGDEIRVLDGLDEALARGDQVLVVEAGESEAERVVTTLDQHQGRFVWSFGAWTFKAAAPEADEEDTA
jgi:SpoU rRNA methylase family enzyme